MTNTLCALVAVLLLCAAVAPDLPNQRDSAQTGRLNSRIGPPIAERYRAIREAKDWENPYLMIRSDGIELIAKGLVSGRKIVSTAELNRTLLDLPVSSWPYGRIAAVQESGPRPIGGDKAIADHLEAALAILKKLDVTADRWP